MKRQKKIFIAVIVAALILWAGVFTTDLVRCYNLKAPIFAISSVTADDGGSGIYKGLGYTVEIEKHIDAEYGVKTDEVLMRLFGIPVFGVIVD